MRHNKYYREIIGRLQGDSSDLKKLRDEDRLDFAGITCVLRMYESASMEEKLQIVSSMKQIIGNKSLSVDVVAQTIDIAASLEIHDVEGKVRKLAVSEISKDDTLQRSIKGYRTFLDILQGFAAADEV